MNMSWAAKIPRAWWQRGAAIFAGLIVLVTIPWWWGGLNSLADLMSGKPIESKATAAESEAGRQGGNGSASVTLSDQARRNLGLRVEAELPGPHQRFLTLPAIVVERPGETRYQVVAPFTGIVTAVSVVPGQMTKSSDRLFTLRLTHEDLVNAQKEFLLTLEKLDVERRELRRLEQINSSVMARKILLEKQYQIEILEADLKAQRNALHLHGLSNALIDQIEAKRTLIRELSISVPYLHSDHSLHGDEEAESTLVKGTASPGDHEVTPHEFLIEDLDVELGQAVETGQMLCHLADFAELYIEGIAFEQDAPAITDVAKNKRNVHAIPEGQKAETSTLKNLEIVRVSNTIERESRSLHFYVKLPNHLEKDFERSNREFAVWRYRPGQRMQVRVPVDVWDNVFVLPNEAVADEGLESYVFVENGDMFERRRVHVIHRNPHEAVIANDGSLFAGESVAQNGAHQLMLAVKSQAGETAGGDYHIHADGTRHANH